MAGSWFSVHSDQIGAWNGDRQSMPDAVVSHTGSLAHCGDVAMGLASSSRVDRGVNFLSLPLKKY